MTNPKTFPAAFTNAMRSYERIAEKYGEDSGQARDAFMSAMLKAPDWFKDEANAIAEKMGLMPDQPSGYSDEGEPLYTLEDLAKTLGISYEEAEQQLHKLLQQREAAGLSNDGVLTTATNFNRVQ